MARPQLPHHRTSRSASGGSRRTCKTPVLGEEADESLPAQPGLGQSVARNTLMRANQVRAINGSNVAMEMPSGTTSSILAQHQSAVMDAAHNGDLCTLTDANRARVVSHFKALDSITTVADEELGPIRMQNVMFRLSATPGQIRFAGRRVGADTETVLSECLGIGPGRVAELRAKGAL